MSNNLSLAQEFAWSLATSLMACVTLFRAEGGYAVVPTAEFDGDADTVVHEFDLGLRQDKAASEVVREVADPAAPRAVFQAKPVRGTAVPKRKSWHGAVPPRPTPRLVGAERRGRRESSLQ